VHENNNLDHFGDPEINHNNLGLVEIHFEFMIAAQR
jgi:hypothetical protein